MEKTRTLESAFEELETVTKKLEDKNLPLEQAFALYEEGMKLVAYCNGQIDTVEKKIIEIRGGGNDAVL